MYTAVVLNDASIERIYEKYSDILNFNQEIWTPKLHHVTLHMGDFDPSINNISRLGDQIHFTINSFAYDDKVAAFGIQHTYHENGSKFGQPEVVSTNQKPHITAFVNFQNGGKPFLSNNLKNWGDISTLEVIGVVEVCK